MSQDEPTRAGAPTPLARPQRPADPTVAVENPATTAGRAPDRVVPAGFSRGEDAIYQEQWGTQQPWRPPAAPTAPPAWQQAPPPSPSRARVPAALPLDGQVYAQVLRPLPRRVGRWFLAWAIAAGFFMLGQAIAIALMMPSILALLADPAAAADPASAMSSIMGSPMAFLGVNLSWAAMIPGAIVALAAYGDRAMGFAFSVAGRWRWRAVGISALVVTPPFAAYVGLTMVLEPGIEWRWQPDWLLVAIVLLTTPLQSTGEEFAFRGFVTQQLGSWIRNRWVASTVTGAAIGGLFGSLHIGYPPLAILQVALVGFTASMLTFRTGGLEAASVMHTANNVFIMLPLALVGVSPFATSSGEQGPFWLQLVAFLACVAALGLSYLGVHLVSKRWQRRTEGAPGADLLLVPRSVQPAGMALAGAPGYGAPGYGVPQPAPGYGAPQPGWQPPLQQPPQQWAPPQWAPQQWAPQQPWVAPAPQQAQPPADPPTPAPGSARQGWGAPVDATAQEPQAERQPPADEPPRERR